MCFEAIQVKYKINCRVELTMGQLLLKRDYLFTVIAWSFKD